MKHLIFMGLLSLALSRCTPSISSTPSDATNPSAQLPLEKHQVPIQTTIDGRVYLQLFDTTATTTARQTGPIYTCECSQAGTCQLEVGAGAGVMLCVPVANGCAPDPNIPSALDGCTFKKVADQSRRIAYTLAQNYDKQYSATPSRFDAKGMRYPQVGHIAFKDPKQLKASHRLKDGRTVITYHPMTPQGLSTDPVKITCTCDCPDGSDCKTSIMSPSTIVCELSSKCMPKPDGEVCRGCHFEIIAMTDQALDSLTEERRLFGED